MWTYSSLESSLMLLDMHKTSDLFSEDSLSTEAGKGDTLCHLNALHTLLK